MKPQKVGEGAAHYRNRKGLVRGKQRGARARATEAAFCRDNRRNSQLAAGTAPREWPSLSLELLPRINNRGERGRAREEEREKEQQRRSPQAGAF